MVFLLIFENCLLSVEARRSSGDRYFEHVFAEEDHTYSHAAKRGRTLDAARREEEQVFAEGRRHLAARAAVGQDVASSSRVSVGDQPGTSGVAPPTGSSGGGGCVAYGSAVRPEWANNEGVSMNNLSERLVRLSQELEATRPVLPPPSSIVARMKPPPPPGMVPVGTVFYECKYSDEK